MMWVLMCGIALMVGFMFYSSIEDKIPENYRLSALSGGLGSLVESPAAPAPSSNVAPPVDVGVSSQSWQVTGDGRNVELMRDFQGRLEFNGQRYDAPTLILTCYDGTVFARVDLHMAPLLEGTKATVQSSTGPQQWNLGQGHDLYSPTPKAVLNAVRSEKPFTLGLSYAEIGMQTVTFNPSGGIRALKALPSACR